MADRKVYPSPAPGGSEGACRNLEAGDSQRKKNLLLTERKGGRHLEANTCMGGTANGVKKGPPIESNGGAPVLRRYRPAYREEYDRKS